eukprot:GHVL01024377.1.p1 GENE.GHVL01024377.1~~GHVL01024377.1.p1  ORF type:complete len:301 (+),score=16.75 GHVL01024377.1:54-956(+)
MEVLLMNRMLKYLFLIDQFCLEMPYSRLCWSKYCVITLNKKMHRLKDGNVYALTEHLKVMTEGCNKIGISFDQSKITCSVLSDLVRYNDALIGSWRLKILVTAGSDDPVLGLPKNRCGSVLLHLQHVQPPCSTKVMRLQICPQRLCMPNLGKCTSYLTRLWFKELLIERKRMAPDNPVDDLLVLHPDGTIQETITANVFWIEVNSRTRLVTPKEVVHNGSTLNDVIKGVTNIGWDVHYASNSKIDSIPPNCPIYSCNSVQSILQVGSIDNTPFPLNELIFKTICKAYADARESTSLVNQI